MYKRDIDSSRIQYLLGKIPQGNFWTVFKGLPEENETPMETALREFAEETGNANVLRSIDVDAPILKGRVGKKDLFIYLVEGSDISESIFNMENVVRIDSGYMEGQPEIIAIQWLTYLQAMEGCAGAKIYNSQQSILQQAEALLLPST